MGRLGRSTRQPACCDPNRESDNDRRRIACPEHQRRPYTTARALRDRCSGIVAPAHLISKATRGDENSARLLRGIIVHPQPALQSPKPHTLDGPTRCSELFLRSVESDAEASPPFTSYDEGLLGGCSANALQAAEANLCHRIRERVSRVPSPYARHRRRLSTSPARPDRRPQRLHGSSHPDAQPPLHA
jgi:hypothetical protein